MCVCVCVCSLLISCRESVRVRARASVRCSTFDVRSSSSLLSQFMDRLNDRFCCVPSLSLCSYSLTYVVSIPSYVVTKPLRLRKQKVFPEKPLKQKLDRMHQIQKLCVEQPEKLDREQVYWELAGLYIIVNREASRPELNISKPSFVMVAPEKFEEDPTVDKRANDSRKQELYLPCCSPDDLLEKNVVEQMLLEVEQELERRVDELMEDGEREE